MYVRRHFTEDDRTEAITMVRDIREAFQMMIEVSVFSFLFFFVDIPKKHTHVEGQRLA